TVSYKVKPSWLQI
ncbi:hypothetical protein CP8484711_0936B, partial [Chlamydia psittaci 84-8471/1]